ncbi:M15 family metallopeptidase [Shewanella mangrovi]|nr:M15 family metallopeptidase [Shewanella mangrovi]
MFGFDEATMVAFIDDDNKQLLLDAETLTAFSRMKQAAAADGIQLNICSGFRHFEHQCRIWNSKAVGRRKVLDADAKTVDINTLSPAQLLQTMLIWSAIPGMSRHHWGTDLDLFDASALQREQLRLVNNEYIAGGPCHKMFCWLETHAHRFGFYRPFQKGISGTSEELWHYSYYPRAQLFLTQYSTESLQQLIANQDVQLKTLILAQLNELVQRFVRTVALPPVQ